MVLTINCGARRVFNYYVCFEPFLNHLGPLHLFKLWAIGCWITWFISSWEESNCYQTWANSQNDNFWVKTILILWIYLALPTFIFFSAWDKSRDLCLKLEQMKWGPNDELNWISKISHCDDLAITEASAVSGRTWLCTWWWLLTTRSAPKVREASFDESDEEVIEFTDRVLIRSIILY